MSTLYNSAGVSQSLVVTTPPGGPTGQVFASGAGFLGNPSFIFSTLAGGIDAWGGGTTASIVASTPGAVYTGLALANPGAGNRLYAADTSGGKIDVFDSNFGHTTVPGSFFDPGLPTGYVPYNIQNVGGRLYVEYSQGRNEGAGLGAVSIYDANGNFVQELISPGGQLNAPWGVTLAPATFGSFANDLLVGNFGDGRVNAFNPLTGAFLGTLTDANGSPLVNNSLWALTTRPNVNPDAVFFTAGINEEADGLFGSITSVPEPSAGPLCILGLIALGIFRRFR